MDLILVTNYWHFPEEKGSSRYFTLATMLAAEGIALEVVTSSFYHRTKSQRQIDVEQLQNRYPFKISIIDEPSYGKNISLRRLASHRRFAKNVLSYLREREAPDAIYCAVPSLDVGLRVGKFARKRRVPFLIDVQDLWPEAFNMRFSIPGLSKLAFWPALRKANRIYSLADSIIAVSQTYVDRALGANRRLESGTPVFLGLELTEFDRAARRIDEVEKHGEFWLAYAGSLGASYDLETVIDALALLRAESSETTTPNVRLIVMGDGPKRSKLEHRFTGMLRYEEMVPLLCSCDAAVNPIHKRSAASIINKHGDYFAAGLPIVNSQESPEFRDLLDARRAGLNCTPGNPREVAAAISTLLVDRELRNSMASNSRITAVELFDRAKTYNAIISAIREVLVSTPHHESGILSVPDMRPAFFSPTIFPWRR